MSIESMEWLRETIAEELCIDPNEVTPNAHLINDLGADSLDIAEISCAIEEKYEIEFPEDEELDDKTVQQLHDYTQRIHSGD